ncbi:MAG: hypothetical protein HY842_04985, partial [Bacteroidetes bacterium]|nr:hypothetical protein [Bacteroidota bacterium]
MPPSCILLTNTDLNINLTGWTLSGSPVSTADAYAGGKAAELSASWATMKQTNTGPVAGRVYTLSAYAKIESTPSWAVLLIRFYNSSSVLLSETSISVKTTAYTEHRVSSTAPVGTYTISIDVEKSGSGKLKVDEFCLEETIPTIGQCILVENGGFENGVVGWNTWNGTVTNNTDAYAGASAAKLSSSEMSMYRQFGITPGETYQLTAWAKTSGSIDWAELFVNWFDASGNIITDIIQPVDEVITSYSQFTLKGQAPSNALYAEIGAYKDGSGSLYLDDLCFSVATPLGGSSFDLTCGCSDNLVPNGGFESSNVSSFPYTLDGKPAAAIGQNNNTSLYPWSAGISSYYMFYVKDIPSTVNNPEGDYYVWLPNSGDCWVSNTDFSNNLLLEDGETYTFCFYAASRSLSLNSSGYPTGGVPVQRAGILNLEFTFVSGFKTLNSWSVPASSSATNLSWTKFEYTFTYDILDPISNFVFTNSRSNVGMYIDAVSLSKVNCPAAASCNTGGLTYDRWGSISGTTVNDLVSNTDYPNNYDETGFLSSFQGPQNYNNNYGTRVYGYLVPPATGNYTFTVTSGDASKLYLSSDNSYLNKALIAEVTGFTGVSEYTKYAAQTSAAKALIAGQPYYIELAQKAGSVNSDHFQVYWQTPSSSTRTIIPSSVLRPICSSEVCDNGRDDDFDGLIDCADSDCSSGMSGNFTVTDEACGVANGGIDMQPTGSDAPFSYRWSDMTENAMWTFEDGTDDDSGNGKNNNGITGYPIYTGDEVQGNKSLYFNGSTAIRYSIDGGFMEVALSSLTVSMWIKPDNLSGTKTLFEEGGSSNSSGIGIAMQLNNSTLQAGVRRSSGTLYSAGTLTFPNDGNWHHVAMVFNAGKIRLFLDGTPGTETTANFTSLTAHSNNGGIGGSFSGSVISSNNNYYMGKMDDVRYFFNQALSSAKISDLATNNGNRTSLAAGVYNVTVSSASGCSVTQSVTVASGGNYTNGGTISGNETGCGGSYDPALISSTAAPSPGAGTTEYKWQYSDDSGTTWVDIASSNSASYDPPGITAARMYRRAARLVPCTGWVYSNNIAKSTTANFLTGGTISSTGNESDCGAYDPQAITATNPTSGSDISFKIDPPVSGSSNGATYTITYQGGEPMFLTVTGENVYKVTVKGGPPTATYTTPPFTNMTSPINPNNGTPYGISHFDIWVSGGVNGTTEYKWQRSINGGTTWEDIASSNVATYDPTTLTQTT